MFDLPTDTRLQRKAAGDFRNFLLDEGFERSQFSIYARFINGKEAFEGRVRRIELSRNDAERLTGLLEEEGMEITRPSDEVIAAMRERVAPVVEEFTQTIGPDLVEQAKADMAAAAQ